MWTKASFMPPENHGFVRVAAATPHYVELGQPMVNAQQHLRIMRAAEEQGVKLLVFPELSLTLYTLQDAFVQDTILQATEDAVQLILKESRKYDLVTVFGGPIMIQDFVFNAAYVAYKGELLGIVLKTVPPNYREFTETRWFHEAEDLQVDQINRFGQNGIMVGNDLVFKLGQLQFGVLICEDIWTPHSHDSFLAAHGATIIACLNGSNFQTGKPEFRLEMIQQKAALGLTGIVYSATGEGESTSHIVLDGHSFIVDRGVVLAESRPFEYQELVISDVDVQALKTDRTLTNSWALTVKQAKRSFPVRVVERDIQVGAAGRDKASSYSNQFYRTFDPDPFLPKTEEQLWQVHMARVYALKRRLEYLPPYMRKLVIGLSGGKDSTNVLMLAYHLVEMFGDTLGMTNKSIHGLTMPGLGTTDETYDLAVNLAQELGITFREFPIGEMVGNLYATVGYPNLPEIIHEKQHLQPLYENGQAFTRKNIELAYCAGIGGIDLVTASLSEIFIGWFTFSGDGTGHYAPNAGMAKSVVPVELEWLAEKEYGDRHGLRDLLLTVAGSVSTPELLPLSATGELLQKSEEINGPDRVRDFYTYWLLRFNKKPTTILRMAADAYQHEYHPQQLYSWLDRFLNRLFTNWFKSNMQPIDTVKIGAVAPGSHDFVKLPSDLSPKPWLEELRTLSIEALA